jgi:hypothetical protein
MENAPNYTAEVNTEETRKKKKSKKKRDKPKDIGSAIKGLANLIQEFPETDLSPANFKTLAYLYQVYISALKIDKEDSQNRAMVFTYIQNVWALVDQAFSNLYDEISLKLYPSDSEAVKYIFDNHKKNILEKSKDFKTDVITEIYQREKSKYNEVDFGSDQWRLEVAKHFIHSLPEKELSIIITYVNAIDAERKNKILQAIKEKEEKKARQEKEAENRRAERSIKQRRKEAKEEYEMEQMMEDMRLDAAEKKIDDITQMFKTLN